MRFIKFCTILTAAFWIAGDVAAQEQEDPGQQQQMEQEAGKKKGQRRAGQERSGRRRQRGNFAQMLRRMDRNQDQMISKDEAPERMLGRWDQMDTNGDEVLDQQEIRALIQRINEMAREGRGMGKGKGEGKGKGRGGNLMQMFDKNGDQQISKDEVPERMQNNWDRMDQNGDGVLDQQEVTAIQQRMRDREQGKGKKEEGEPRGGVKPKRPGSGGGQDS